jgi:hypothetical protein
MQMKIKYLVPILLIVFIFSFTACKVTTSATTAAAATLAAAQTTQPAETITAAETTATAETAASTTAARAETTAATTAASSDYGIGDTGHAGGFIFYVNPNYEADGWRYLEAAPSSYSKSLVWYDGVKYVETGATGTAIGTGMSNTQKIVDILGNGSYAAKLCVDLIIGGYHDWFLPSKDELNEIYRNLYLKGIGSFENYSYWSSSEITAFRVWVQYFNTGDQYNSDYGGGYTGTIIAVRAF